MRSQRQDEALPGYTHGLLAMTEPCGLFWDVDGTLAETERDAHRAAFNAAFAELGFNWFWDENVYGQLLQISGGEERLRHWLSRYPQAPSGVPVDSIEQRQLAARLQHCKQRHYRRLVAAGTLSPRPGVMRLIHGVATAGWQQWIVTTSSRSAVEILFDSPPFHTVKTLFQGWICGDDVQHKKPHPQAYQLALARCGLPRNQVLVIEDSAAGLVAAQQAGLKCLVSPSHFTSQQEFPGAVVVLNHLGELPLQPLTALGSIACALGGVSLGDLQQLLQEIS